MTESTELTLHRGQLVSNFDEAARAAQAMAKSGYFSDARDVAQAMTKILAGHEMGFGPFASMTGIHVIKGKPTVGANLKAAAVKAHPKYDYRADISDDKVSITFYQGGDELGTSTFTMEDAKDAGLTNRDNWKKYSRNMLFARAISNGVKWFCPDVFAGVTAYTPDELDDNAPPPDWDIVDGKVEETEHEPQPEPAPQPEPKPQPVASGNGNGNSTRPYDPPTLRDKITSGIDDKRNKGFTLGPKLSNYRGAMNNSLELCFAGDQHSDQKRHLVLEYLTGKASSKEMDDAEVKTVHKWLNAKPDDDTGEWFPDDTAKAEAQAVAKAAAKDAGQTELGI